jgi:exonuclease SbcD
MPIQLVHVSDIHFGSGESHGRINPATGLNTRFEDFVASLTKVVDYSINNGVDVFLFSGDAYRNASPEPIYQKFFARELKRLSDAGIKTILVVGNHDQILRSTSSHAMSVFQSLAVPGLLTIDKPLFTTIATKSGAFQLIGLPHITRHQLLTLEKYASMPAPALDRVLIEHITDMLRDYYDQLDPDVPSVVTAHMAVDTATAGIEQELLIGYTLTFPAEIFVNSRIDYVALGHIHKHQVVRATEPLIVYAGSLDRVDFGEEREDKGFIHVDLERGKTSHRFCSIQPRPFITVDVDVTSEEQPMEKILNKLESSLIPGCVLRIRYKANQEQLSLIDEGLLRERSAAAMSIRFQPEIVATQSRARLPELTETSASSPISALETYLSEVAPERKDRLMERARTIMADDCEHNG